MNEAAWLSVLNTAGTELPPRSRDHDNNLALAALVPCETVNVPVLRSVAPQQPFGTLASPARSHYRRRANGSSDSLPALDTSAVDRPLFGINFLAFSFAL